MNDVRKSIGWADYTWNPVTGCRRACPYCYAKRIHDRFEPDGVPFSHVEFHPDRLLDKMPKKPSRIFVGSVSDFEYWERPWIEKIIEVCKENKQHTFMFLSKGHAPYWGYFFPDNCILGVTQTLSNVMEDTLIYTNFLRHHNRGFVSIEPIQGRLYKTLQYTSSRIELVIVGAMTGPGAITPKPEWIQSVKDNVPAEKIYWKNNIKKYL